MKIITIILSILLSFTSCDQKLRTQKDKDIFFYNITKTQDLETYNGDSVKINLIKHHAKNDTLLEQSIFELNGKTHRIYLYTNFPHADIDGGYLAFELDTLGIIYAKSTTWKSYSRLKSTNDSINDLITVAFENIILNNKFHNIDLTKLESNKTFVFEEPHQ
jgi:hypothetical protein